MLNSPTEDRTLMIDFRLHLTLCGIPRPTEAARDRLDRALARWNWGSFDSRAVARAVTGELVDDALQHGGTAPDISLQLTRSGRRLRIEVTDSSSGQAPDHPHIDPTALLEHAAQWGNTSHPYGGTTVWCELLDLPEPRRPARSEIAVRTLAA
jgi:hypothetical protein